MDENRIDGAATTIGGKVKDAVGGLVGDASLQTDGKADQISGRVQNAYGSAKDALGDGASTLADQLEDFVQDKPIVALLGAATVGFLFARLIDR